MATTFTAYSVYYYDNQTPPVGHGMAGRIVDNGSTVTPLPDLKKTDLNGDPKVEGFADGGGTLRIAVTDYTAGTARPTYVYGAAVPGTPATATWSNVTNLYSLVKFGSYLYAIDYDNARVVEINATTYAQTGVSYTLPAGLTPSGFIAHGQALAVVGGNLYGLFTFVDSAWSNYANSLLVRFTVSGGSSISVGANAYNGNFAKNAFSLAPQGNDLYVAAIGGTQVAGSYNPASRVQKIDYTAANLGAAAVIDVLSPSAAFPYEFRDISFKGATAYILLGAYNSSWQMAGKLVSTSDFSTFATVNDFSGGAPGYFWSAQYTADNDRIWFARGKQILVYSASSPATPVATLGLTAGSLISTGELFDNLNDLAYVGALGARTTLRGYRSPLQASRTARAMQGRTLAAGRPELTAEQLALLDEDEATA